MRGNKMAEKTWKIGESAKGGVITARATKTQFTIIGKEWDFSKGSGRGSNQSNAKPFTQRTFGLTAEDERNAEMFLNNLTTSYYTDQIMDWIKTKVYIAHREW
jgi:hypothetical protein